MTRIVCILPKGEGFSLQQFGAVALCVRDFTLHSRHRTETTVTGTLAGPGFEGIRYVPLPHARWYENRTRNYARQCIAVIRHERAELAEIHNRPKLLRLIAPKVTCRLALHLHNDPQEMDYARTPRERRKLLERANAVYCVSNYIRDRFLEGLDAGAQAKLHLVYNGLDMPPSPPEKEKLIVFAGRMTEGKGALPLARALRIALPHLPGWRAVLIGSGRHAVSHESNPYETQVDEALKSVAGQIDRPGFLLHQETLGFFARASIAVVPSLWQEPFGRTALEAMAYGCAVISSGRGGLREVTGDAALTLDDLAPEMLSAAILGLAGSRGERERLQHAARERAARFSIAERARVLDDARDAALAGGAQHAA